CTRAQGQPSASEQAAGRVQKKRWPSEELYGRRSQRRVPECCGGEVPFAVTLLALPPSVELAAVAFDDDPTVQHEVDAADAADLHLKLDRHPERSRREPRERLRPRLGSRIDVAAQALELVGQPFEDLTQIGHA